MHPQMYPYESISLGYLLQGDILNFIIAAAVGALSFWLFHRGLFWILENKDKIEEAIAILSVIGLVGWIIYLIAKV